MMDCSHSISWKYCPVYAHFTITGPLFRKLGHRCKNAKGNGEKSIYHHLVDYASNKLQQNGGRLTHFDVNKIEEFLNEFERQVNNMREKKYDDTVTDDYVEIVYKDFQKLFPIQ